jgi:hypothetical protein
MSVKLDGFKDLEKALAGLATPATRRSSGRRALRKAAEPMARIAQGLAPMGETRDLAISIKVGTRLSKRQARMHRKMFRDDRAAVEIFVGAGPLSRAWNQEFGNIHHAAQPYLRPAWDQDQRAMLKRLKQELWSDIEKAAARAARRAARQAAKV